MRIFNARRPPERLEEVVAGRVFVSGDGDGKIGRERANAILPQRQECSIIRRDRPVVEQRDVAETSRRLRRPSSYLAYQLLQT